VSITHLLLYFTDTSIEWLTGSDYDVTSCYVLLFLKVGAVWREGHTSGNTAVQS